MRGTTQHMSLSGADVRNRCSSRIEGTHEHRLGHGMCSDPSPPHGGGGLYVMSRDRVRVSDIERCFPGVAYDRTQGCRVRFDRVASSIHHHPAAASTFETPQLGVYTFNISSTGRCLSSLDAASGYTPPPCSSVCCSADAAEVSYRHDRFYRAALACGLRLQGRRGCWGGGVESQR